MMRMRKMSEAGGWRRLFVAGAILLAPAAVAWTALGPGKHWEFFEQVEHGLILWSIGANALGLLILLLALLDRGLVWVGSGFGLASGKTRAGFAAVLAGLTFLGVLGQYLRYETVMPEAGTMRAGELCVVLDRWTGETRPCTDEALSRYERKRAEPQRVERENTEEYLLRRVVSILIALLDYERWLPRMTSPN